MSSEMSTDEIRANIKLGVRTSGVNPRYAIIESNFSSLTGDFDERYVALTGHVGCLNPHMFAAAPDLLISLDRLIKTGTDAFNAMSHYAEKNAATNAAMNNLSDALDAAIADLIRARGEA